MRKSKKEILLFPLSEAVINNDLVSFNNLITEGVEIDGLDYNGLTALYYAAQYGRLEMARVLIEKGANIEHQDEYGNTPLMRACLNLNRNGVDMISLLISSGANVDAQNKSGNSPRRLSKIMMGFPEIDAFKD